MLVVAAGMNTDSSFWHELNASLPMLVTDEGIWISLSPQFWNTFAPMESSFAGVVTLPWNSSMASKPVQLPKAEVPSEVRLRPSET